jgi:hypothetical protein
MLKVKKVKLPTPVCTIFDCWGGNFDKIEHIEDRFEKIRIGRYFREIDVNAGE